MKSSLCHGQAGKKKWECERSKVSWSVELKRARERTRHERARNKEKMNLC